MTIPPPLIDKADMLALSLLMPVNRGCAGAFLSICLHGLPLWRVFTPSVFKSIIKTICVDVNDKDGHASIIYSRFLKNECARNGYKMLEVGDFFTKKVGGAYTKNEKFVRNININTITMRYLHFYLIISA